MPANGQVRWGIIGTANIARAVFLPGLRQARPAARADHAYAESLPWSHTCDLPI